MPSQRQEKMATMILELALGGSRPNQISKAIEPEFGRVTVNRIQKILDGELVVALKHRRDLRNRYFELKIEQMNMIVKHCWSILNAPCLRCNGKGHHGQDPDKAPGVNMLCDRCAGEGKHHDARERIGASKELRMAIDQQAKMLGMYVPDEWRTGEGEGEDELYEELRQLGDEQLDESLRSWTEAVEKAKAEQAA